MTNIFLAPRSNETAYKNYISSMQGKKFTEIRPFLSDDEAAQLEGDDKYFVWGCQPSLQNRWNRLNYGDYILFYAQGKFISVGTLKFKKMSKALALSLWPESKVSGIPWSCVFFVENVKKINLTLPEFNSITGYTLPQVQGFMRISRDDALNNILTKYGTVDNFIASLTIGINEEQINEIINISSKPVSDITIEDRVKIDKLSRDKSENELQRIIALYAERQQHKTPQQVVRLTKSYKRNTGMTKAIKERFKNKCQICGFTFKTAAGTYYSEAAHVIPISKAQKGVDSPDNIWILCANHHKMLDMHAIEATGANSYILNKKEYQLLEY